ncbi:MAG: hypothetical protein ICV83_05455 [Cytophagales bacterium]|nr:hypothetical protein [Cytophagales bacterium]
MFDTTIWIAYLNGAVDPRTDLLYQYVDTGQQVLTCPIIIQEVAFYALHFDVSVCHDDHDFDLIASQTGLKIFQV